ncbi:MAG: sulfatase [Geminicoccaceae bacterium]
MLRSCLAVKFCRRLLTFLLSICVPVGLLSAPPAAAQDAAKPNIVFILLDDLEVSPVGYMNWTKTLVRNQGTEFQKAYLSVPLCGPSRAGIVSGKYPQNSSVYGNSGHTSFRTAVQDVSTMATWLHDAGYRTSMVGKYMNNYPKPEVTTYIPPGWDDWHVRYAGDPYDGQYKYKLNENGVLKSYGSKSTDYSTDLYRARAVTFVRDSIARQTPFFLYFAPHAPHSPFVPAPRDAELFPKLKALRSPSFNEADVSDKPAYVANRPLLTGSQVTTVDTAYRNRVRMVQAVDKAVKAIIDALVAGGQFENTYIIFASDNGWIAGPHRFTGTKGAPYEEVTRMVFFLRGPGVPAGLKLQHLAANIDIAPTIAELAGVEVPADVDGRSLAPLLRADRPEPSAWRQSFLMQFELSSGAPSIPSWIGLRTPTLSYVSYPATSETELYDHVTDPYELANGAATADPRLLAWLAAQTAALSLCSGAGCRALEDTPIPTFEEPPPTDPTPP